MRFMTTALLLGVLPFGFVGCGSDAGGRLPVSGTITLKGQPVAAGTISFEPKSGGTLSGGMIKDGKYEIPATQGLMPGSYVVRISAANPGAEDTEPLPGESGPPAVDLVPPQFNAQSMLDFEVKSGEKNQFNFDVP